MADLLQAEVGAPEEVKGELRRLGKIIALRATAGRAESFTLAKRHPMNRFTIAAESVGQEIWDVWDDQRRGGGPPDGLCYGTLIVDIDAWRDASKTITISESTEDHVKVLLKQGAGA